MKQPNQQDQLAHLWQQQQTTDIDLAVLKRKVSLMRLKQAVYVVFDFLGVFVGLAMMFMFRDKMSPTFFNIMFLVIFCTLIYACYLLYLRRFVLFSQSQSTLDYMTVLKQQIGSNVRIARYTKHSCWITVLVLMLLWLALGIMDDLAPDQWLRKGSLSIGLATAFCVPLWFWARNREQKFKRELSMIEQQELTADA